jgi:hypothetical protein
MAHDYGTKQALMVARASLFLAGQVCVPTSSQVTWQTADGALPQPTLEAILAATSKPLLLEAEPLQDKTIRISFGSLQTIEDRRSYDRQIRSFQAEGDIFSKAAATASRSPHHLIALVGPTSEILLAGDVVRQWRTEYLLKVPPYGCAMRVRAGTPEAGDILEIRIDPARRLWSVTR